MLTHVEFQSGAFPPYEGESDEINPGRYGKRLAEFLSAELRTRGENVGEFFAEDWGWVLPVENEGFNLWIGVGNYEEYEDGFMCFIEPHKEFIRRLWKKIPTRERIEVLQQKIAEILSANPEVNGVKWSTYEEFNTGVS